jgi:hypothetical protein
LLHARAVRREDQKTELSKADVQMRAFTPDFFSGREGDA